MFRKFFLTVLVAALGLGCVGALVAGWGYFYVTRDLPKLSRIEDYKPPAVTRVVAADGTLIAEFYSERRYPVKLKDVPVKVRNAFLAAEDAGFYSHKGIDPVSIARAVYRNIQSGSRRQGGSTITQQVVKNLLLTPEKNIIRKLKEAILSYRLERRFSKDEILEIYLNQIFFGNTAYGIRAAAQIYFRKEISELSLGEAAILAALPKAPSGLSPLINLPRAKERQHYVLDQMVKVGFATPAERDDALKDEIKAYPPTQQNIFASPYYVGEIRRQFAERWKDLDLDSDGLEVETAVDVTADVLAAKALRNGLRSVDKRRGWRGPIAQITEIEYRTKWAPTIPEVPELKSPYPAMVLSTGVSSSGGRSAAGRSTGGRPIAKGSVEVLVGSEIRMLDLSKVQWARKFRERDDSSRGVDPASVLEKGDLIEVAFELPENDKEGATVGTTVQQASQLVLDQTPDIEGGLVLLDPHTGKVSSMVGGYAYGQSQFNRVTQSLRQPGSTFKPVVYLAAVDKFKYTPSTIVYDTPRTFRVGDTFWTPANFDQKFLGPITLRTALEKSRNLVSADIISRIGVDAAIEFAKLLGIESPLGRNLSLSLGSSEVTPLELSRAYGVFAAKGVLFDSVFVTKIRDRFGAVLYDYEQERLGKAKQVISPASAFVMANMMKGVIESGTGYKAKELRRPVAGKTGTSNDQMDAWFIGYTPQWVVGVWVGFDQKKQIGSKETGGMVSTPIWVEFMKNFLEHQKKMNLGSFEREARNEAEKLGIEYREPATTEQLDFSVPDGVEPFWVYKSSGVRAEQGAPGSILEYFIQGTEPESAPPPELEADETSATSYLESPDL